MPSLGASYHNCVFLMPTYKPALRHLEHEEKEVQIWSEDSVSSLQACLDCTDWDCFYDSCENIDVLGDTVSSYISFCVNSIIPSKKVVVYPNNKPWVTKELKTVINKKKRTFFTGDLLEKKALSREVRKEIAKAKVNYKNKIEMRFAGGNIRAAWQGLKSIACVNKQADEAKQHTTIKGVPNAELPNAFNCFFSRFESCDFTQNISALKNSLVPLTDFVICKDQVTALLKKTNIRKAAGPDAVCGRTLRYCANQLSEVFSTLFQMCVNHCQLPLIWKSSTIIPIPKTKNPEQLTEFRPVALTSLIMKIFEKILKDEIVSLVYDKLDPLQFAYQPGKGVEDAKLLILDKIYKHLEKPKSHVRLLFADFSSAFNKMQPHILIQRLSSYFNLPDQFLLLLLNF
ncbi:uncharacterized protein LOC115581424 [Sparus aurata]|uniref:uncharacterized protein LOC115581424 n=1 Tax=Sparus aurata TaxID=8175 RepID=UPI0011C16D96|nr:uncharacterized protein LOC115581424 [Sparus aurata]